jgi:glycosyltransferase involved in cell wall biosynthesis
MKVLIVNNMAPFVWGGAEELAKNLDENLREFGHETEILRIPFRSNSLEHVPAQMGLVAALEGFEADRVIALKFPAYLLEHPHKTVWLLHQYRQAYDLFDARQTNIPRNSLGHQIRGLVWNADNDALGRSDAVFTNSRVTAERLQRYNGLASEVLLPPLNNPELFTGGASEGYIFAGGRINSTKRQSLLVRAMAHTSSNVRLVIAGPPQQRWDSDNLRYLAESLNVSDRVHFDMRFLGRGELAHYVNSSLACAYIPFDEDSMGYVAMEAAEAGKAILTTTDSGGVKDMVESGVTGWVVEPTPEEIGRAMTRASLGAARTRKMGLASREKWHSLGVNWASTINKLVPS